MEIRDTLTERNNTHGDFTENSRVAQQLKSVVRHTRNWSDIPPYMREEIEMRCHKLARRLAGNWQEPDHIFDEIGYLQLSLDRLTDENTERQTTPDAARELQ